MLRKSNSDRYTAREGGNDDEDEAALAEIAEEAGAVSDSDEDEPVAGATRGSTDLLQRPSLSPVRRSPDARAAIASPGQQQQQQRESGMGSRGAVAVSSAVSGGRRPSRASRRGSILSSAPGNGALPEGVRLRGARVAVAAPGGSLLSFVATVLKQ